MTSRISRPLAIALIVSVALLSFAGAPRETHAAATIDFLQSAVATPNIQTYTFSSQNLGTAAADRYIIVYASGRDSGTSATSITEVTVGGVTATEVVQTSNNPTNSTVAGLFIAAVPTGTTGDIVITFNTSMVSGAYAAYRATGIEATATDVATSTPASGDPSTTIDITAGGFAIGGTTVAVGATRSAAWTGLTEDVEELIEGNGFHSSAHDSFVSQTLGQTVSVDLETTPIEAVLVAAAWEASGGAASNIKTFKGVAKANVKTVNGVPIANVKSWKGVE